MSWETISWGRVFVFGEDRDIQGIDARTIRVFANGWIAYFPVNGGPEVWCPAHAVDSIATAPAPVGGGSER